MGLQPGQVVLHFRILEQLGAVESNLYKAEDLKTSRLVALKVLSSKTPEERATKRRLLEQAGTLGHPNIVTIHTIEQFEDQDVIVREYLEGEGLEALIARGPLEISRVLDFGSQVADALVAVHSAGMIWRGIRPSRIFITLKGLVKLLDYEPGQVVVRDDRELSEEQTTSLNNIIRMLSYMSPEETRGEFLDLRTDVYSLGCVLFEAATGKLPFSGRSIAALMNEIVSHDAPIASTIRREVPPELDEVIRRSLSKQREQRYATAAELGEALRSLKFASRYQILREIGRGGMGVVYLARDPLLDREVAVKVITPDLLSAEAVERFKREARVVAKMDHPAIVGVHDIGEADGSLFFVMPFVDGLNLRAHLKENTLNLGDVIDIGIQVAEALEYSHSKDVVHRDIKPENILVMRQDYPRSEARVRVTDFGLATASTENRLTRTGALVGTVAYLSPEQLTEQNLDGRSDIYALGTILYECLVGKAPFTGEIQSVLYRIAHEIPQSPRALGSDVQDELEEIVMQCLEKDRARRPQSAGEVADALIRYRAKLHDSQRAIKISEVQKSSVQVARPAISPLVGREKEFAELQRRLNAALTGECQFAVVAGEAGIGKSRLLDEMENLAKVRKIRLLHSRFVEQDQAFPYQGFCEAIQEYFRLKAPGASGPVDFTDLAADLVSLFPVLAEMAEITGGQKMIVPGETRKIADRTYVFDLLARSFVRIGGGKPLILLFEDLQNADMSLDVLQYVVRRLGPTPTFIVGTYRTTEVDKHHPLVRMLKGFQGDRRFSQIQLEPFSESEYRTFLRSLIGSSNMEEDFINQLYEATEGNPHFTKELIRSLMDSGRITKTETGSWNLSGETTISSDSLPPTIQETVEKRIERLAPDWREILSIASILGRTFDYRDLEVLAGDKEDMEDIIDGLITSGFVEEERGARRDQLTFSSGVVHDVLYAQVPRRRRRSLHRKFAEELEKRNSGRLERVYPLLVHHYSEGDVPEKVIEFGFELARKSMDAFSPEAALRAAKTVLDFVQGEEGQASMQEGEVRSLLAAGNRAAGNFDAALQEFEIAIGIFESHRDAARVLQEAVHAAETAWEGRRADETRRWVEKAIPLARAAEHSQSLARLLSLGATIASLRGDYERAKQYLDELEHSKPVRIKEESPARGGNLVAALPVPVVALHPVETTIVEESEVLGNVFETLLSMDEQGHLIPCLSEAWEVMSGGRSFLFTVRANVLLHDGEPLTSHVIKQAFERAIRLSRVRLPAAFAAIRGVPEYLDASSDEVAGIVVQTENKLRIDLSEPLPIYPALLTDTQSAIAKEYTDGETRKLDGTGPFRMASFQKDRVVLQRNDSYWKGEPAFLDSIEFQCGVASAEIASGLRSGKLDLASSLLPQDLEQILQDQHLRAGLVEAPKKNTYFALFNHTSQFGGVPEIRKAVAGVVRTHDIVRSNLGRFALPAEGLLPPGILGHDPGRRRQPMTREKATEIVESTGLTLPIELRAAVHPILQDRYVSLIRALFKVWAEIGVEVSIETPNMASFLESDEKSQNYDMRIARWQADYDDPDNFTYSLFQTQLGRFRKYYSSQELDKWIEEARAENRTATREKHYGKIENFLMDNGYLLPLFHEIDYRVAGPRVQRLTLRNSPPFVNYAELSQSDAVAPGVARKSGGGIIHVPLTGEVTVLDPSGASRVVESEVLPNIFETLTRETEGARIIPWIAAEFHPEEGGRSYRFRLREDIRFHDGRKLTARDVRYSFEHLLRNKDSLYRFFLAPIHGAKELLAGKGEHLDGFQMLSSTLFRITLDEPVSFFPALLAFDAVAIVPEGSENPGRSWREHCVGTGPFRVVRFEPGKRLELEPNPYYWRQGYPRSDGLVFSFGIEPAEIAQGFKAGRFSLASELLLTDLEAMRHDPEFAAGYRETPRLSIYYAVFNSHRGPLADEGVRRQLIHAVDVDGLIRRHVGRIGIPAHGFIPPGLLGYESSRHPVPAPEKTSSSRNVELTCMANSVYKGSYSPLAQELFDIFRRKGFEVRMKEETKFEEYNKVLRSAPTDIALERWVVDYPDTDNFVGQLHSEKGLLGRFCGMQEIDRLIERGCLETRPELRHDIYREVEQILARRALILPLFHEQTYRFACPEMEGFEIRFSSPVVPYEKIWIRK